MSLRVQKTWDQLGSPTAPGEVEVPGLGLVVGITQSHLDKVRELGGTARVVLEHQDSDGFDPEWVIAEIRSEN